MNEIIAKKYQESASITSVLQDAINIESNFAEGMDFGAGVRLRAYINSQGLWEMVLVSPLGLLVFSVLDEKLSQAHVQSFPNVDSSINAHGLNPEEKLNLARSASKEAFIDLKDIQSLKTLKLTFKDDYILSNIVIDQEKNIDASEFLIASIRNYRRLFKLYEKKYNFLWNNTGTRGALNLQRAINNFLI